MKKKLLIILIILCCKPAIAQLPQTPLEFDKIPMTQIDVFCNSLTQRGYVCTAKTQDTYTFTGKYDGYDITIEVICSQFKSIFFVYDINAKIYCKNIDNAKQEMQVLINKYINNIIKIYGDKYKYNNETTTFDDKYTTHFYATAPGGYITYNLDNAPIIVMVYNNRFITVPKLPDTTDFD